MIRLAQPTSDLISLITAQNGARAVVSYSDATATAYTGATQVTSITSATTTTICGTPGASTIRDVDYINIKNTYAGSHTITVQLSVSATLYVLITCALLENESICYTHGSGWTALDANGNRKEVTSSVFSSLTVTGNATIGGTLGVTGATTLSAALTYGGVTLTNAVTGIGKMVLDTTPTLVTPVLGAATGTSLVMTGTTDATSISTGALQTAGGAGITKALWVGGLANIAGAVTLQNTLGITGLVTVQSSGSQHTGIEPVGGTWSGLKLTAAGPTILDADTTAVIRVGGSTSFFTAMNITAVGAISFPAHVAGTPTWVTGDKYLVVDSSGNIHVSAVGPAS